MATLYNTEQPKPTKRQVDEIIFHLKGLQKSNELLLAAFQSFTETLKKALGVKENVNNS